MLAAAVSVNAYADKSNFKWVKDINYEQVRLFSNGHSAFMQDGKWGFINAEGEVVVEPQYEDCHDYVGGYAAVKIDGKWGFINSYHDLIVAPEYDEVRDFKDGLAIVRKDMKWGVINTTGKTHAGIIFDEVDDYKSGFALAMADSVQYYLDDEGEIQKLHRNYEFTPFSNGLAAVKNKRKEKWGYIDTRGRMVIEAKYDTACSFSNNVALVQHRDNYKYIRKSGAEQYVEGVAGQPLVFVNGFAKIKTYSGFGFINRDFKKVPREGREVSDYMSNGLAALKMSDGKLCYINTQGKVKFVADYDMIGDFSANGLALVRKNGKYGYINSDGKLVIDTLFTEATDFRENLAYVATKDRFGYIRYANGYKTPDIQIQSLSIADADGDGIIETGESFAIATKVYNPSNEDLTGITVSLANLLTHEEWFEIQQPYMTIHNLEPRTDSLVLFNVKATEKLESSDLNMRLMARAGNALAQDISEISFETIGIAASKPLLSRYWIHTDNHSPLEEGVLNLNLTVKNDGTDPAKDVKVRFTWPSGAYSETEEINIETLKPSESKDVLIRFETMFINPEETVVAEISNATGNNTEIKYLTYYQGSMSNYIPLTGNAPAYNPYSTPAYAGMYNGYGAPAGTMNTRIANAGQTGVGQKKEKPELLQGIERVAEPDDNKYALIIGNEDYNKYNYATVSTPDVEYAIADAEAFREYAMNYMGVPANHVIYYTDALGSQMRRGLNRLQEVCESNGGQTEIYFFYAGHGQPDEEGKTYLIPCDGSLKDPKMDGFKLDDLYASISSIPAKKRLIFIDACYSGQGRAAWAEIVVDDEALKGNTVVMTATSGTEKSMPYAEKKQGTFTYHLLNTIKETKGEIQLNNLYETITRKVIDTSVMVNDSKQTPQLFTGEGIEAGWEEWKLY